MAWGLSRQHRPDPRVSVDGDGAKNRAGELAVNRWLFLGSDDGYEASVNSAQGNPTAQVFYCPQG